MSLIKVIGYEKISIKIILAHAETAETTENSLKIQNDINKTYWE